jgi:hypothetical protein
MKILRTSGRSRSVAFGAVVIAVGVFASLGGVGYAAGLVHFSHRSAEASQYPPGKVTICHHTHSQKNPFVTITVSVHALPAHLRHGDTVGACTQQGQSQKHAKKQKKQHPAHQNRGHHGGKGKGHSGSSGSQAGTNKGQGKGKSKTHGHGQSQSPAGKSQVHGKGHGKAKGHDPNHGQGQGQGHGQGHGPGGTHGNSGGGKGNGKKP